MGALPLKPRQSSKSPGCPRSRGCVAEECLGTDSGPGPLLLSRAAPKWTTGAERKCPTSMKRKNHIGNWVGIGQEQVKGGLRAPRTIAKLFDSRRPLGYGRTPRACPRKSGGWNCGFPLSLERRVGGIFHCMEGLCNRPVRIGWPIVSGNYPDVYSQKASWRLGASAFSLRRKRRWSQGVYAPQDASFSQGNEGYFAAGAPLLLPQPKVKRQKRRGQEL